MTDIQKENNNRIAKWLGVEFQCDYCGTYNPNTFEGRLCLECAVEGQEKFYFIEEINKSTSGKKYSPRWDFLNNSNHQWLCLEKIAKVEGATATMITVFRWLDSKVNKSIYTKLDLFNAILKHIESC